MIIIIFRADLVQYEKLSKSNAMYNLNHAFNLAEKEFGLTKLLDAEVIFYLYTFQFLVGILYSTFKSLMNCKKDKVVWRCGVT